MRVAVLGAGIQGVCLSMELASRGVKVDLYEKNDTCVSEASAQNEGKIHLGYVYGNDHSLRTARLMARGAVTFSTLMGRWIGDDIDLVPISTPFLYAVHRNSLISPESVEHHLMATNAILQEERSGLDGTYFGIDCCEPPVRLNDSDNPFACKTIQAAFTTPEIAIDPEVLARVLRDRVESEPLIQLVMPAKVLRVSVERTPSVEFEMFGEQFSEHYDQIVIALWDGRLAIDASAGIMPERPWTFRVKHYVRAYAEGLEGALPSVTVVLGPFGDIVRYADNHWYFSWYPAGIQSRSHDLTSPEWKGLLDEPGAARMGRSILLGLGSVVPALMNLDLDDLDSWELKGGVIFAWGTTDIADSASKLHERYQVGPRSYGRYHSVDTGKLTLAPLFAKTLSDHICGDR